MKFRRRSGARALAAPSAALALLLLCGCSQLTPGTAAVVNGTKITDTQVNDLADAQCLAADRAKKAGQSSAMAISRVKRQSLGLLMDTQLSLEYADHEGIEPDKALSQGFYGQLEPSISVLPGKTRTVLTEVFQRWAKGRAILVQAGSKSTGQAPSATNLDQLTNAGLQARVTWLKKAAITTDPRYAPNKDGFPGGGDGSVSRASSPFAKGATADQADAKWVSGLPADQRCG